MNKSFLAVIKVVLCAVLVSCLVFALTACGDENAKSNYKKLGSGENDFYLEVKRSDTDITRYHIYTDLISVGEALEENNLITYAQTAKGEVYISTCDGKKVDFEKENKFWALYSNGAYISSSPKEEPIMCGSDYTMQIDTITPNPATFPSSKFQKPDEDDEEQTDSSAAASSDDSTVQSSAPTSSN